jgi:hypothetical protein
MFAIAINRYNYDSKISYLLCLDDADGVTETATSGSTALADETAHELGDGSVDQMQDELQSFLRTRPPWRGLCEAKRWHRDDVRAEPHGEAERQSNRRRDARHNGGDPTV